MLTLCVTLGLNIFMYYSYYKNIMHLLTVVFKWKRKPCRSVTVFSCEVCIILLLREFKTKIHSSVFFTAFIISVLFFPFKYFKSKKHRAFLYYQKSTSVTMWPLWLMLEGAKFYPPYSYLSGKRIKSLKCRSCDFATTEKSGTYSAQQRRANVLLTFFVSLSVKRLRTMKGAVEWLWEVRWPLYLLLNSTLSPPPQIDKTWLRKIDPLSPVTAAFLGKYVRMTWWLSS